MKDNVSRVKMLYVKINNIKKPLARLTKEEEKA